VRALFERLEFRTLLRRLPKENDDAATSAAPALVPKPALDLEAEDYDPFAASDEEAAPATEAKAAVPAAPPPDFRDLDTAAPDALSDLARTVRAANRVAVRLHVSDPAGDLDRAPARYCSGARQTPLTEPSITCRQPRRPRRTAPAQPAPRSLPFSTKPRPEPVAVAGSPAAENVAVPDVLRELLEAENVAKVTHQAKSDVAILARHGCCAPGVGLRHRTGRLPAHGRPPLVVPARRGRGGLRRSRVVAARQENAQGMATGDVEAHQKQETFKEAEAVLATMRCAGAALGCRRADQKS
jgi:hypothetical protein